MEKHDILKYVQQQMVSTPERLRTLTHDRTGNPYPKRYIYFGLEKHLRGFIQKDEQSIRSIVVTGLRGVGKTTAMAQLCAKSLSDDPKRITLFISLEEVVQVLNITLTDVLDAFQSIIGEQLYKTDQQIFLFIDEVQKDPKWGAILRTLWENNKNIFIFCTGSSAVELQTNADLVRRFLFEKLPPLNFGEYEMIKNKVNPISNLKQNLNSAVYHSQTPQEAYALLRGLEGDINKYWSKVDRADVDYFLKVGTLPYALAFPSEARVFASISHMLDNIAKKDLLQFGKFDQDTLLAVQRLLFILAENDTTSIYQLERALGIKRMTIQNLLDAIEKTELLIRVPAYGSNMSVAKKPSKYLFMSPAIRMSFFHMTGNAQTFQTRKGKLLEDLVGAHLYREFTSRYIGELRYDAQQGGADFILQIENRKQIAIEVGLGTKTKKQLMQTMNKVQCDFGIIISSNVLDWDEESKILSLPLDYFLLM